MAAHLEAALTAEWLARAAQGTIEFGFVGHAPALDSPGLLDVFRSSHPDVNLRFPRTAVPVGADQAVARPKWTSRSVTAS